MVQHETVRHWSDTRQLSAAQRLNVNQTVLKSFEEFDNYNWKSKCQNMKINGVQHKRNMNMKVVNWWKNKAQPNILTHAQNQMFKIRVRQYWEQQLWRFTDLNVKSLLNKTLVVIPLHMLTYSKCYKAVWLCKHVLISNFVGD